MSRLPLILAVALAVAGVEACGGESAAPSTAASSSAVAVVATGSGATTPSPSAAPTPTASPSPVPAATPTPSFIPIPVVQPTPTPAPLPWKAYKSKRYHYTIKYPPTWVATPASPGYDDEFDGYRYPYVYASRDTVSGSISVSRTVTQDIAYYKSHYKAKLVSNKSITLRGWAGRIITYNAKDNGVDVTIKRVIIGKGNVAYFLTLYAQRPTSTTDSDLFKKMYGTFRPT